MHSASRGDGLGANCECAKAGEGGVQQWLRLPECVVQGCRSAGNTVEWDGDTHTIEELTEGSFGGVDIALFSAGGSISKKFAPVADAAGCTVRCALA